MESILLWSMVVIACVAYLFSLHYTALLLALFYQDRYEQRFLTWIRKVKASAKRKTEKIPKIAYSQK